MIVRLPTTEHESMSTDIKTSNVTHLYGDGKEGELIEGSKMDETLTQLANVPNPSPIKVPRTVGRANLESAFLNAFELIGGQSRLALWANDNPGEFFKLTARLFPQAITGADGKEPIKILHAIAPSPLDRRE